MTGCQLISNRITESALDFQDFGLLSEKLALDALDNYSRSIFMQNKQNPLFCLLKRNVVNYQLCASRLFIHGSISGPVHELTYHYSRDNKIPSGFCHKVVLLLQPEFLGSKPQFCSSRLRDGYPKSRPLAVRVIMLNHTTTTIKITQVFVINQVH